MSTNFIYTGLKRFTGYPILAGGTLDTDNPIEFGLIYQDTLKGTRAAPTETDHFAEGEPENPVVSFAVKGVKTIALQLMQYDPAVITKYFGGEVVVVDNKQVWKEPRSTPIIEIGAEIENKNGLIKRYYRLSVTASENDNYMANELMLIDLSIKVLAPTNSALPPSETIWPDDVEPEEE